MATAILILLLVTLTVTPQTGGPPLDPAMAHVIDAQARVKAGDFQGALAKLEEARKLGTRPAPVAIWMAVVRARLGNRDAAFAELMQATALGVAALPPQVASDPGIAALKSDARYAELERALDRNARPCEHDPLYRQFDYWVGTWDVRPNGGPASAPPATNIVTKIHNGCVILESWSAPGMTGQSFNIYDRVSAKWRQTWVDSTGGLHEYAGGLVDGNMTYEGDIPAPRGQQGRMHVRLTFFKRPDGTVRQFSERTPDGGKTWQVNYDLIYTRRPAPEAPKPEARSPKPGARKPEARKPEARLPGSPAP
jgi:hypothetical protein